MELKSNGVFFFFFLIKTSLALVTKLGVNNALQFGPGIKHDTSKIEQYIYNTEEEKGFSIAIP